MNFLLLTKNQTILKICVGIIIAIVIGFVIVFSLIMIFDFFWGSNKTSHKKAIRLKGFVMPDVFDFFFYSSKSVPEFLKHGYSLPSEFHTGWGVDDDVPSFKFKLKITFSGNVVFLSYICTDRNSIHLFEPGESMQFFEKYSLIIITAPNLITGVARLSEWWSAQNKHQKPFHYLDRKERGEIEKKDVN